MIRLAPNHALWYIQRGDAYLNGKKDYDRAIADFTQAIRLEPNNAWTYSNRGNAYYGKGDYDRAIADCTQAIRLNPNYPAAYSNRGNAYERKGEYDRAIADHTQAIRLDPNYKQAYNNRGVAYQNKGDVASARADFTKALQIDPNYTLARNNLNALAPAPAPRPAPANPTRTDALAVAPETLLAAYEMNAVRADNAYKGKTVRVTGWVELISNDVFGDSFITFMRFDLALARVQVYFKRSEQAKLAALYAGQQVTIVGKCTGQILNVLIMDAVFE